MTKDDAKEVAEQLIATSEMRGFTAKFAAVHVNDLRANEYVVMFDLLSPEGNLLDGDIVVIVNMVSGEAHAVDGP